MTWIDPEMNIAGIHSAISYDSMPLIAIDAGSPAFFAGLPIYSF
jgi:hypothetical protein